MAIDYAKQEQRLAENEAQLRCLLVPALKAVVFRVDTELFVTKHNNPWSELQHKTSETGAAILELAEEIVGLANRIGIDTADLLATKVLKSFLEANDLSSHHRLGPIRRAQELLHGLGES